MIPHSAETIMKYHAPTNQFTVSPQDLQDAAHTLRWAIKHIRLGHDLNLKGYSRDGLMQDPDFAEAGILEAAKKLGIDLGADRFGKLDVSDAG
jgi:hypothetical protein